MLPALPTLHVLPPDGRYARLVLFMVIERFKDGDPHRIGERFREKGRMMPEGVEYVASWIETKGDRCFQLMEAPSLEAFEGWTKNWDDLMTLKSCRF